MSDTILQSNDVMDSRRGDIVVGVDGSDESFAALRWALGEASLTGQQVNAVYAWTHSWDMGSQPEDEEQWAQMRHDIARRLREWVAQASQGMTIDENRVKLTSVKATGTAALLEIGKDAQQIVVGRRSLGRVARWFLGSLSASLAEEAKVPVTVVRILDDEEASVQDAIANALTPTEETVSYTMPGSPLPRNQRPVVVGVDGSETSKHALRFAIDFAALHHAPLQVMFCWQLKDLGEHSRRFPNRIARFPYSRLEGAYRGFPLRTSSSGRFARLVRSGRAFPWIGFQANHQLRRLHRHRRALTA